MEWLKELLKGNVEEDKIETIVESFKKEFPKHAVTKTVFNETNEELKTTKASLVDVNTTIEKLNKEVGSIEEYKSQVETLQTSLKDKETTFNQELSSIKKKTSYKELLMKSGVNDAAIDLLVKTADYDTIEMSDDGIRDPEKLIGSLREARAGLFNETKEDSTKKNEQHSNDNNKSDSELSMAERFEKMGVKPLNQRYT